MNNRKNILIAGASSTIGTEILRLFAPAACSFFLIGRSEKKIIAVKNDLMARGAEKIFHLLQDFSQPCSYQNLINSADDAMGAIDIIILAHGILPDQKNCEEDYQIFTQSMQVNFLSIAGLSMEAANYFEKQGRGSLIVISSVAGDRGRQSNYVYGTAKAAISTLLQGLRNRCAPKIFTF